MNKVAWWQYRWAARIVRWSGLVALFGLGVLGVVAQVFAPHYPATGWMATMQTVSEIVNGVAISAFIVLGMLLWWAIWDTPKRCLDYPPDDHHIGLYGKYEIVRRFDPSGKHRACNYFVLDPKHDPYAAAAMRTYAGQCKPEYPQLAADLYAWAADPNGDPPIEILPLGVNDAELR